MKKFIFLLVSFLYMLLSLYLYLKYPNWLSTLDSKIRDEFFLIRGKVEPTGDVVIVDIDEKSLNELGQWPWSRDILAKVLYNLTNAGAGIIGLDIFFPEKDTKSPSYFVKKFHINEKLPDTDEIFANAIANTPSILGYLLNFESNLTKNTLPNIPAIFIQKNLTQEFLLQPKGYIANIPILQNAAYSSGYLNMIPESDGVVRAVPLVVKYDGMIYPSLAFEMFRIATGVRKVIINYSPAGVDSIQLKTLHIPTDRFGRLYVNYRGGKKTFKYISISDIYFNKFNPKDVEGKFVLIGTSAAGLFDLRVTPFDTVFPGIEVHANIIDNLLKGDILYKPDFNETLEILGIVGLTIILAFIIYLLPPLFSLIITFGIVGGILYADYYLFIKDGFIIDIGILIILTILLTITLNTINYLFERKKSEKLKKAFARKVSPKVMEELLKVEDDILAPRDKEITIFFSDVRSFTTISEAIGDPKRLIEMLNRYMTPMTEIIIQNEGTIDKFIGDAIMAYWNAPTDVKDHPDKAVTSAILQIKKLKEINVEIKKDYGITLDIGIGINTGIATIGEMGSIGRSDYTVIGDSVNTASRLEGLNKIYKSHIIISEYTKAKLKKDYIIRELDRVRVKGKKKPLTIYEVLDFGKRDFSLYHKALHLYYNSKFKEAKEIFEKLYNEENEHLYQMYITRCENYIKNPPQNFDGVYTLTTK